MIRGCVNILAAFTSLFVSLLALIILIFVSIKLTDISFNGLNYDFECLLGTNTDRYTFTSSNCLMLQILSGLTIGVGLVIGIIQCYTCNLCGVGGVLDGLFALCGAGAWGYAAGILQTAVDSNGNLRNEYESSGEVNTANQELQQALNASSASSISPVGEQLTEDYDTVLDQRRAAGIMTWIEFGLFCALLLMTLLKCCPGSRK
mmetsp:Transcript_1533/g.5013  ORF Transcript_1533/g.5013 Transcript_1533/m.5013 type:complete len:204 (-) Transcript_1533:1685-2296(-)